MDFSVVFITKETAQGNMLTHFYTGSCVPSLAPKVPHTKEITARLEAMVPIMAAHQICPPLYMWPSVAPDGLSQTHKRGCNPNVWRSMGDHRLQQALRYREDVAQLTPSLLHSFPGSHPWALRMPSQKHGCKPHGMFNAKTFL